MPSEAAYVQTIDKQEKTIDRLRKRGAEASELMASTVATIAGGPLCAWLDTNRTGEKYEHFGFSEGTLIGAAAMLGGLMKMAGQYSSLLQNFGGGVLTIETYKAVKARMTPKSGTSGEVGRVLTAADLDRLWQSRRAA